VQGTESPGPRPKPRVAAIALVALWFGAWLLFFVSFGFIPEMTLGGWRVGDPLLRLIARSQVWAMVALFVAMIAVPALRKRARLSWPPILATPFGAAVLFLLQLNSFVGPQRVLRADAWHQCAAHGWDTARQTDIAHSASDPCFVAAVVARRPEYGPPASIEMMICETGSADGCAKAASEPAAIFRPAACRRLADLGGTSPSCPADGP
jgi:hypothetical protein